MSALTCGGWDIQGQSQHLAQGVNMLGGTDEDQVVLVRGHGGVLAGVDAAEETGKIRGGGVRPSPRAGVGCAGVRRGHGGQRPTQEAQRVGEGHQRDRRLRRDRVRRPDIADDEDQAPHGGLCLLDGLDDLGRVHRVGGGQDRDVSARSQRAGLDRDRDGRRNDCLEQVCERGTFVLVR